MDPFEILQLIIRPDFLKYYQDWIHTASEREARGLQLMGAIYKHKGRKLFRAKPPTVQLAELTDQQELEYYYLLNSFKKAEEMHRKNQTTTTYSTEFGYLQKLLKPQNNVFKFKKCSEMEFSKPLSDLAKLFMDNWIELNDELEFQELVLACMRALFSRLQAQWVPRSEMKIKYESKPDWNLSKPIRVDKAGTDLNAYKTNYNAIFKQRLKQEQIKEKIKELDGTEFAKKLEIHKSFKIN